MERIFKQSEKMRQFCLWRHNFCSFLFIFAYYFYYLFNNILVILQVYLHIFKIRWFLKERLLKNILETIPQRLMYRVRFHICIMKVTLITLRTCHCFSDVKIAQKQDNSLRLFLNGKFFPLYMANAAKS